MKSLALRRFEPFLATSDLPSLGPEPRTTRLALPELNRQLDDAFRETALDPARQTLIRSLVLLWHDHLDESHSLSQEIHTADGSYLHGIMHRREPDYWNAKYWFNKAGRHSAFPRISEQVASLLQERNEREIANVLLPGGNWSPEAFVDLCEQAASDTGLTGILRQVQQVESRVLLEQFCEGAA